MNNSGAAPYLNVQTTVDEGVPKDAIVDAARRWNADLIVLGSYGYGRIRRILLGSVATGVLSEAPCSVLVARVKQNSEEGELETFRAARDFHVVAPMSPPAIGS